MASHKQCLPPTCLDENRDIASALSIMQCGRVRVRLQHLSLVDREDMLVVHCLVATGPRHPTGAIGYAYPRVRRSLKQTPCGTCHC